MVGGGCTLPNPGNTQNNAFVAGCATVWTTGVGSPSLCNAIPMPGGGPNPPVIIAPNGNIFACLGSSSLNPGGPTMCMNNESIVQTVNLCQNSTYTISFQYNNIRNSTGTLSVLLTNAIPGVCVLPVVDIITTIPITPAPLAPGAAPGWVTMNVPIPPALLANTNLVFVVNPNLAAQGSFDVGIDNVSITCQQTPLIPQIAFTNNGGGNFTFNGSTNAVAGVGVANWCWNFGDGNTATGQNPTHTYSQPGTYNVCLTIEDNCGGCTNRICTQVVYDPCACLDASIVLDAGDPFPTFAGGIMDRDVILLPGEHITISGQTLQIKHTCKFVVMRGASLTVDNSTLTNECDGKKWQGIVVWGNSSVDHSTVPIPANALSDPGIALIQNNSNIMNAQTALEPQRWWSDPRNTAIFAPFIGAISDYWGGIVQASDSRFYDNRKSADIGSYFTGWDNACEFTNCEFTSSATIIGSGSGAEGVCLWDNWGVAFVGNEFNIIPARGISAIDAGFTVNSTLFTRNFNGIQVASVTNPSLLVGIGSGTNADRNTFSQNKNGISSDGWGNLSVRNNHFAHSENSGVRTINATNSLIWWNDFENNNQGITLGNTGGILQSIECNTHKGDDRSVYASANCMGVHFTNNNYSSAIADIVLRGSGASPGKLPHQGAQNQSVLNYFSTNESDNDIVTIGATNLFNYYPPATTAPELIADPTLIPRTLPDCDNDDGCAISNNFHNQDRTDGSVGCNKPDRIDDDGGGKDKDYLDSLRARLIWLNEEMGAGNMEYEGEAQRTESQFLSDKRLLTEQWFLAGDIASIEQTLAEYNETDDKKLLYSFYIRLRQMDQAAGVLESIPNAPEEDGWFKEIQHIYMAYITANVPYVVTEEQNAFLEAIALDVSPVGSNARAMYYLLHGIWLEPELDPIPETENRQSASKTSSSTTALVLIPNPANDKVSVRLPSNTGTLQLYNAFGKLVRTVVVNEVNTDINTSMLPNGLYSLQYVTPDGARSDTPLIIQH